MVANRSCTVGECASRTTPAATSAPAAATAASADTDVGGCTSKANTPARYDAIGLVMVVAATAVGSEPAANAS